MSQPSLDFESVLERGILDSAEHSAIDGRHVALELQVVLQAVEIDRLRGELERARDRLDETYRLNSYAHNYEVQVQELNLALAARDQELASVRGQLELAV
jgi:hypothetical protein